eukprot:TRINITY_DN61181_c0_g1_i1.p1 TRINITY_DN61181_c0_g1~~TRINITY_DN61181_c0_g1_i1.p1  ORF type:complete len:554 (+),score=223.34 TRINITY_DN61181_c0_g1_i1:132-1793(+)
MLLARCFARLTTTSIHTSTRLCIVSLASRSVWIMSNNHKRKARTQGASHRDKRQRHAGAIHHDTDERKSAVLVQPVDTASACVDEQRVRLLTKKRYDSASNGVVVYWMSRDQRVRDNWALLYAQQLCREQDSELHVVFCMMPKFLGATLRQYSFMIDGLRQVEESLSALNIPFRVLLGDSPVGLISDYCEEHSADAVVTDFSPLRVSRGWCDELASSLDAQHTSLFQVDAHNVVPCWLASDKREYAARTLRPKIRRVLDEFLTDFPDVQSQPASTKMPSAVDWNKVWSSLQIDRSVTAVDWLSAGEDNAYKTLMRFTRSGLKSFDELRNNPNDDVSSNLSPYLHFGQIAAQRCALVVQRATGVSRKAIEIFIEEAVVRKELADNYCYYVPEYDSIDAAYGWARETLDTHASDKREWTYTCDEFEAALTHDDLWNAAQLQMVKLGKMHGFLRMYWAKKILEWSESPEEALRIAIYLNDKYELDGRDPNGYCGVAWSILGVHDQGWAERPVFGKIRYMNYRGCKRKFRVDEFVARFPSAKPSSKGFKMRRQRLNI